MQPLNYLLLFIRRILITISLTLIGLNDGSANTPTSELKKLERLASKGDQDAFRELISRSRFDPNISRTLGVMYFRGIGTPKNILNGLEFFEQAANLGDQQSISFLAKFYGSKNSPYSDAEKARYYDDLAGSKSVERATQDLPSSPPTYRNKFNWKPFVEPETTPKATGSGFAVNKSGVFITNQHVIEGCKKLVVTYNEKKAYAEVVAASRELDLAAIVVTEPTPYFLALRNKTPMIGERVKAAGYPRGYFKFSEGIISATNPEATNFQFSASISSGSSGGPVVDQSSTLVGVARGGIAPGKDETGYINGADFNFAVDSVYLKKFLTNNSIDFTESRTTYKFSESDVARVLQKTSAFIICY
jgi:S1-C subfamily serine protease